VNFGDCNRLEVNELRHLLSLRTPNSSERMPGHTTLEDACTELEYLRNILYEYMMGKEPVVSTRLAMNKWESFYEFLNEAELPIIGIVFWLVNRCVTGNCGMKENIWP
jgi:hypothetical protein